MSSFAGTCCGDLASVGKLCAQYALGLSNVIHIAEACDLDSIPDPDADSHTVSGDIVMDDSKVFYQWRIGETDVEFNSNSVGIVGSQSFQNTLTVFLPILRDELLTQINSMINGEFVIEFGDKNGTRFVMGSDNSPVMIPEGGIQSVISAERNGSTITFQNVSHTPYIYTGAIALT